MVGPLDVGLEVSLLCEGQGAVRAVIGALTAVLLQMDLQCVLLVECLVANLTDKWTLS